MCIICEDHGLGRACQATLNNKDPCLGMQMKERAEGGLKLQETCNPRSACDL